MSGRRLIKGKPRNFLEGYLVVDLGFQFWIGVNAKPLFKQQAFRKDKRESLIQQWQTLSNLRYAQAIFATLHRSNVIPTDKLLVWIVWSVRP
jgi:hypothetical protein